MPHRYLRLLLMLLALCSLLGFLTSYLPGVWGTTASFWLSDLIATLSYFTIITNLLILAKCLLHLMRPETRLGLWVTSAGVETALAVYITVTGLVYHLFLADTWNPTGIDKVSDILLHTVTPVLYIVFWWFGVRGKTLPLKRTVYALSVPLIFLVYWLIRGPLIGAYPYFFMDITKYGVGPVMINMLGLCLVFWCIALFYWALNRFTTPLYV